MGPQAIQAIFNATLQHGGSTYHPTAGNLAGRPYYSVAVFPEFGQILPFNEFTQEALERFISDRLHLLDSGKVSVGTWHDKDSGLVYLDIVATPADRSKAVKLGQKFNQIAIFDLAELVEIPTGGTGDNSGDFGPVADRLSVI